MTSSRQLPPWLASVAPGSLPPAVNHSRHRWPAQDVAQHTNNDSSNPFPAEAEESLEELTALCMQTDGGSHCVSLGSGDANNMTHALQLGKLQDDLERTGTHDSTSTASLLPMLQDSFPGLQQAQVEATSPDNLGGGTTAKTDFGALAAAEEDGDDIPLVSNRKKSILDIMCRKGPLDMKVGGTTAKSPSQGESLLDYGPFLHSTVSSASTVNPFVLSTGGLRPSAVSDSSAGSSEPWGLAATSLSDASVPSMFTSASTTGAPIASGLVLSSPVVAQASVARLLYIGVFLTPASRDVLLSLVPAVHSLVRGEHMTLVYRPTALQLLDCPLGVDLELRALGSAADGRVQAVFVEAPSWLETSSASAHITNSVGEGAKAVEAGRLILEALQQAAEPSASAAAAQAGLGAYQHFDEALPLVGRLGVKLAVPSATAADMGWLDSAGMESSQAQLQPGAEVEVVVYSIEELVKSGCVVVGSDALQAFYEKQGHLLGKQVPVVVLPSTSRLPSVPELPPRMETPESCLVPAFGSDESLTPASSTFSPWRPWTVGAASASPVEPSAGGVVAAATASSMTSSPVPQLAAPQSPCSQLSPFSVNSLSRTPAGAEAAADSDDPALDSPKSTSSGGSSKSSGSSMEAVQFLSAVHEGDYVAVRPFVPTEGQERLLQGYVREFACYEPFQAEGVLAVLTDNTIGYVAMVLDSAGGGQAGCRSSTSPAAAPAPAAHNSEKRSSSSSKAHTAALVAYPVDPNSAPGSSSAQAAAEAARACSSSDIDGPLKQWMLEAGALDPVTVAPTPEPKRRSVRDVERDLQLWHEFESLQQQHGESLCNSILETCNQDFAEAIELIKGQRSSIKEAIASAAGGAAASAPTSPAATSPQRPVSAGGAASRAGAAATAGDEGLVQQLALSLGLQPADAVQLARLVPHLSAEAVVQELQKQQGDVGQAADVLLSTQQPTGSNTPGSAASSGPSSPTRAPAGAGGGAFSSLEERAAQAFMSGKDPERIVLAQRLREISPSLTQDLAELLLEEHGGNFNEAAQAVSEMQARELQARTLAAATSSAAAYPSSSMAVDVPSATFGSTSAAVGGAGSPSLVGMEGLSEADQLAILTAMGEFEPADHQQQQQWQGQSPKQQLSVSPVHGSPVLTHSPPKRPHPHTSMVMPGPTYHHNLPGTANHYHPPPPPPPPLAAVVNALIDVETRRAAKAATDALYDKATKCNEAAQILMTAAQDELKAGNTERFREYSDRANAQRKQAKEAIEEAQRVAWSANNQRSNCWEVDLHGLPVAKAIAQFEKQFRALQTLGHPGGVLFRVIVGKGKHSEGNVPKIKLGILQYLEEQSKAAEEATGRPWGITFEVDPSNPGVVNVHLPPDSEGDA